MPSVLPGGAGLIAHERHFGRLRLTSGSSWLAAPPFQRDVAAFGSLRRQTDRRVTPER